MLIKQVKLWLVIMLNIHIIRKTDQKLLSITRYGGHTRLQFIVFLDTHRFFDVHDP